MGVAWCGKSPTEDALILQAAMPGLARRRRQFGQEGPSRLAVPVETTQNTPVAVASKAVQTALMAALATRTEAVDMTADCSAAAASADAVALRELEVAAVAELAPEAAEVEAGEAVAVAVEAAGSPEMASEETEAEEATMEVREAANTEAAWVVGVRVEKGVAPMARAAVSDLGSWAPAQLAEAEALPAVRAAVLAVVGALRAAVTTEAVEVGVAALGLDCGAEAWAGQEAA